MHYSNEKKYLDLLKPISNYICLVESMQHIIRWMKTPLHICKGKIFLKLQQMSSRWQTTPSPPLGAMVEVLPLDKDLKGQVFFFYLYPKKIVEGNEQILYFNLNYKIFIDNKNWYFIIVRCLMHFCRRQKCYQFIRFNKTILWRRKQKLISAKEYYCL